MIKIPMIFRKSPGYVRRTWLHCAPPSLFFHVCFTRSVPHFDPDRHAMKNVEKLIILTRSNEDLVELTSSDFQEGNEAWKLSFTRFGEVSEFLNDQPFFYCRIFCSWLRFGVRGNLVEYGTLALSQRLNFLVSYDPEIVWHLTLKAIPLVRNNFSEKLEGCIGELLLREIVAIMVHELLHFGA